HGAPVQHSGAVENASVPSSHTDLPKAAPQPGIDLSQTPSVQYGNEDKEKNLDATEEDMAAAVEAVNKKLQQDAPAPIAVQPVVPKTSGEVDLAKEGHGPEDTIYIDQEGVLHNRS
ncbi:MAG TPA: hypothetical protein VD735_07540, partial [Candidatus Saccharimonadales bacterium]|nr:hypothetical protein [Candidatus Saccharimonadales bacterium]